MELYIDVVFLVNGICSCLALWTAGRLLSIKCRWWQLILGGFVPSLFFCLLLVLGIKAGFVLSAVMMILGIEITYFPKSFYGFFQFLIALGVASFLLGGFLEMLFAFTNAQRFLGNGLTISVSMMPWQRLLWGCLLFYILLKAGAGWLERHGKNRGQYCRIIIESGGKTVSCIGFLDTGNALRTEAGKPVVVLELARCVPLLPKESALCLLLGKSLPEKEAAFFSQMPFAAVGISSGMLTWFTAEHLTVTQGKISRKYDQMPIGIYMDRFTGGSAALVPPVLLEEEGI